VLSSKTTFDTKTTMHFTCVASEGLI